MTNEKRHPIQVVARRTGLTADVLRAWEKRYGVVRPERAGGGRRLYSDADIARLRLLREATLAGRSISQVAQLETERLAALIQEDRDAVMRSGGEREPPAPAARLALDRCLQAVDDLDAAALDSALSVASVALDAGEFMELVVLPLLVETGVRWERGRITVAHEHAASAVVRQVLGRMVATWAGRSDAPVVVVATPSGERHEFGAMMVAATAVAAGWRVLYLGADVPVESVAEAARRHGAMVVAVSVVAPASIASALEDLFTLRGAVPDEVTLLVGGRAVGPGAVQAVSGATYLASLAETREFFARVGAAATA